MNTLFRNDRIRRILMDLKALQIKAAIPVENIRMLSGRFDSPDAAEPFLSQAQPYPIHGQWGGRNAYFWFFATVHLPDGFEKEQLLLRVSTAAGQKRDTALLSTFVSAGSHNWDLMNPQFMVFVNDRLRQGMDTNHTVVPLEAEDYRKGTIRLAFQAYTGLTDAGYSFFPEICVLDTAVKELYYDMLTLFEAAQTMSEESVQRYSLLDAVNEAINLLDLRTPGSRDFYAGMKRAHDYLEKYGYGSSDDSVTVHCVGHTHIDMAWLWDLDQTRLKAQRSFSTVLSFMERYPDYCFMHTSPQLYAYLKRDNPQLYERIKAQIADGRWEPEGAMWLEADCNLPCGESLVRQIICGKKFIREEFGRDSHVLWLPDVFGYSAALPQILKKSGIDFFVTSKISWNMLNTMPYDTFLWKGIDGSEIPTYFLTTPELGASEGNCGATYNGVLHPETVVGTWKQYKQKEVNHTVLMCYGYGDGGGGPTMEMLEKLERMKKGIPGFPTVTSGAIGPFFAELADRLKGQKYLPKWTGELYLELHQGTYTSCAKIKKNNRRAEKGLYTAELLQSVLFCMGDDYPDAKLYDLWETLLLNQFHDTLPGSCIGKVYEDSEKQFAQLFAQMTELTDAGLERLVSRIALDGPGLLIFQPAPFRRDALFETAYQPFGEKTQYLDASGNMLPSQRSFDGKVLLALSGLPALGYTTLRAADAEKLPCKRKCDEITPYPISVTHMENSFFSFDINDAGELIRLYDKRAGRRILPENTPGNCLVVYEDRPYRWDSWNIDMYYEEKSWSVDKVEHVEVLERGPLRYALRIRKRYHRSLIDQTIYLYHHIPRIDFVTDIDWQEDSSVLKAEFPVDVNTDFATFEIQYGSVRRPTHSNTSWDTAKYEVCAHTWADISEGGYGVSLLNDCKYGYSVRDGRIAITLLKAGMAPEPTLDRGKHTFTYALYAHSGPVPDGGTVMQAHSMNLPLPAKETGSQKGSLPAEASFFTCDHPSVLIDCVKKADEEDAIILRFYETGNCLCNARFTSMFPLRAVWDCTLMEEKLTELPLSDANSFEYMAKPFSVNTCKLYFA